MISLVNVQREEEKPLYMILGGSVIIGYSDTATYGNVENNGAERHAIGAECKYILSGFASFYIGAAGGL